MSALGSSRMTPADVLRTGSLGLRTRRLRAALSALGIAISDHVLDPPRPAPAHLRRRVAWHSAAWRQYRLERKMFWRNPSAAFFNFVLPLLFLGLFGAILSGNEEQLEILVPGIAGMAVCFQPALHLHPLAIDFLTVRGDADVNTNAHMECKRL